MSEKYWSKRRLIHELRHGRLSSKLDANTIRIVAAVNACAGIPTAALEAGVVGEMVEFLHSLRDTADTWKNMRFCPLCGYNYYHSEDCVATVVHALCAKLDQEGSE